MGQNIWKQLIDLARRLGDAFESWQASPVIGEQTASLLVMVTNGFTTFETSQTCSPIWDSANGITSQAPRVHGQAHIVRWECRRSIRPYVMSLVAVRHNRAFENSMPD